MTALRLPNGNEIHLTDISPQQIVVPMGTQIVVPTGQEWQLVAAAVIPTADYIPPMGTYETRDVYRYGDVRITRQMRGERDEAFRANALALMDRYWGRHNVNPHLFDATMKLSYMQQAALTAPAIRELGVMLRAAREELVRYLSVASPLETVPACFVGPSALQIEHAACGAPESSPSPLLLDVELLFYIKRSVP